ncbi:MAG: hypothetical protein R8F63_05550 [Acidimicrobiales bacterium]|nr:hypothetical protein [Acidimicrobiales bacterium]
MSRRLEPTVLLTTISPITVGLVVAAVAGGRLLSGSWVVAAALGVATWVGRVAAARVVARRIGGLVPRVDPFALREPWRFFVRDALSAQRQFADALAAAEDGPLRTRLLDVEGQLTHAVDVTWDVAQRGQQLTDARNRVKVAKLDRTLASTDSGDPRHSAAQAQKDSYQRLRRREDDTRERLEVIAARLEETITRVGELATRTGGTIEIEQLAGQVGGMVDELDSLRIALDEVGNDT